MSRSAVVVAGDNVARCDEIIASLGEHEVSACAMSSPFMAGQLEAVRPRVAICQPGATGVALLEALQEMADPPLAVVLSAAPSAEDEVYCNGCLLVVVMRMPVPMASLARFVKTLVSIASRHDTARRKPALSVLGMSPAAPKKAPRLRIIH